MWVSKYNAESLFIILQSLLLLVMVVAVTNLTEDKKELKREIKAVKSNNDRLLQINSVLNNELKDVKVKVLELQEENRQINSRVQQLQQSNKDLQNEVHRLKQKNNELRRKLSMEGSKASPLPSRGSHEVGKTFYMNSTAYTAYCRGCSGKTKWGELDLRANPNLKVIAVDPNIIPLGTKVYVEGYGYAIAADTGGAIRGHKIDIFMPSRQQALQWGRRIVRVTILN